MSPIRQPRSSVRRSRSLSRSYPSQVATPARLLALHGPKDRRLARGLQAHPSATPIRLENQVTIRPKLKIKVNMRNWYLMFILIAVVIVIELVEAPGFG